jgi:hypothetical protein
MSLNKYISAVNAFNDVQSFVIELPPSPPTLDEQDEQVLEKRYEEYFNETYGVRLTCHTDDVQTMTDMLILHEDDRKKGLYDGERATDILTFVVHLNQITNGVK